MSSHLGLAFSVENISYAHFIRDYQKFILNHIGAISYPFDYDEREFFKAENLARLSHLIQESLTGSQIEAPSVSISIESNLAKLKRITLPPNLDEKGEMEHINWDLTQSLSLPISEYVYHIAPNHFEYNSIYDTLVVAIQKKIIEFFVKFTKHLNIKLTNLSVHSLAAEMALRNATADNLEGLIVLFKISLQRLETIFIWNGNYFSSEYDLIQTTNSTYSFNEIALDRIKLKIKQIENLFQQFGRESAQVNQIFLYGENITESIVDLISKNISVPVNRLNPTVNLTFSEDFQNKAPEEAELSRYVECIGIALDI
jgi:Tfp pilus assembly PilM family ATPase